MPRPMPVTPFEKMRHAELLIAELSEVTDAVLDQLEADALLHDADVTHEVAGLSSLIDRVRDQMGHIDLGELPA